MGGTSDPDNKVLWVRDTSLGRGRGTGLQTDTLDPFNKVEGHGGKEGGIYHYF